MKEVNGLPLSVSLAESFVDAGFSNVNLHKIAEYEGDDGVLLLSALKALEKRY